MAAVSERPGVAVRREGDAFGQREGSAGARARRWLLLLAIGALATLVLAMSAARIYATVDGRLATGDDFTPYWNGASSVATGHTPYAWLAENRPLGLRDYHYPPLLALLLAPLTRLVDYPTARWAWLAFSVLCVALSLVLIWRTSGLRLRGPGALALVPCLTLIPPSTVALGIGQLSPQLLLVAAGAYAALGARRSATAGGLVAFGAYLKTFPALLGGYLLLRRQWSGLAAAALAGLLLVALSLLILGWEPHWDYFTRIVPMQADWYGGPFNVSVTGFFTRVLIDNAYTVPIVAAGAVGQAAIALGTLALLALSGYAIWRAPADRAGDGAAFALAVVAGLLVSPINGQYNLIIAVLSLAVAAAQVQAAWPRGLRWLLLAALLLGLPVEYYDLWPVDPMPWRLGWGNLLISGPFFGLLALWALLLRLCLEASPAGSQRPAVAAGPGR